MSSDTQAELLIINDVRILLKDVVMYKPSYNITDGELTIYLSSTKAFHISLKFDTRVELDSALFLLDTNLSGKINIAGNESSKSYVSIQGAELSQVYSLR